MTTANRVIKALESMGSVKLKQERPNQYRGNSPFRTGSDSKSFTLKIDDDEHGAWNDHVSGERGSLYDLAQRLNVATSHSNGNGAKPIDKTGLSIIPQNPPEKPEQNRNKKPTRSFSTLEEYAAHQGVPVEAFKKAGCIVIQHKNAPHIAFPCADGINRLRRMDKKAWYPQTKGATPQLYGWGRALNIHKLEGSPLVLTNGQPSVIVAQHNGIAAFCLTDGENKPIPDAALITIQDQLDKSIKLYIAKDADKAGREGATLNHKQLNHYNPTMIDFGGDDGRDLANHCKEHGDSSLDELKKLRKPVAYDVQEYQLGEVVKAANALARATKQQDTNEVLASQIEKIQKQIDNLNKKESRLSFVSESTTLAYNTFQERIMNPKAVTGLSTGHSQLDYAIGGFTKGASHAVLGATGSGKTQLCATWGRGLVEKHAGLIASFECGHTEFVNRMVASECRLPFGSLIKGGQILQDAHGKYTFKKFTQQEIDAARRAYGNLQRYDKANRLKFLRPGGYTPRQLLQAAKVAKDKFGIEWMIIDSLNNVLTPGAKQQESMALAAIYAETIAQECDIAVIVTAQGGRSTKDRSDKRLGLHDGKWSSEIEEKAYVHMSLYNHWLLVGRDEIDEKEGDELAYPKDTVQLRINKSRSTGLGNANITLSYIGGVGFYNYNK